MSVLHLRPRSFSELIDATFHIVRARFGVLATGAALIMVPVMGISLLLALLVPQPNLAGIADGAPVTPPVLADPPAIAYVGFAAVGVLAIVGYVIGFAALVHVASRAYLGQAGELGAGLARGRQRFWRLLLTMIAKYVMTFVSTVIVMLLGGLLLAVSPWMGVVVFLLTVATASFLLLRWSMTAPVIMLEEPRSVGAALDRSIQLTKGAFGRLFAIFGVLLVLVWTASFTMTMIGVTATQSFVVAQVFGNLVSLVLYPFAAVLLTVIYYDLRIRNEAFDLELMAGGLQDAPGGALPPAGATTRQPA
jgi:hypothetical protein